MSLKRIESKTDFREALSTLESHLPHSFNTYYSMKLWNDGVTTDCQQKQIFFAYYPEGKNEAKCFMVIRENLNETGPSVYFHPIKDEQYTENVLEFFNTLQIVNPEMLLNRKHSWDCLQVTDAAVIRQLLNNIGKTGLFCGEGNPSRSFCIEPEHWAQLIERKIIAPEGYHFGPLTENDTTIVSETWQYRAGRDTVFTGFKIKHLPNICLRQDGSNELAAFEMTDPSGFMTHLYTMEKHRGKGLSRLIEMKLAQQLIARSIWPFNNTLWTNKVALRLHENNPLWTALEDRIWMHFVPGQFANNGSWQ